MRSVLLAAFGIGLLASNPGAAQPKDKSIQGVRQAVEVTFTGPAPSTIVIPEPRDESDDHHRPALQPDPG